MLVGRAPWRPSVLSLHSGPEVLLTWRSSKSPSSYACSPLAAFTYGLITCFTYYEFSTFPFAPRLWVLTMSTHLLLYFGELACSQLPHKIFCVVPYALLSLRFPGMRLGPLNYILRLPLLLTSRPNHSSHSLGAQRM